MSEWVSVLNCECVSVSCMLAFQNVLTLLKTTTLVPLTFAKMETAYSKTAMNVVCAHTLVAGKEERRGI